MEKNLSPVELLYVTSKATSSHSNLCVLNGTKDLSTELNRASERLTLSVRKTVMPCVEGDRSDCQPLPTTTALSLWRQAIEFDLG